MSWIHVYTVVVVHVGAVPATLFPLMYRRSPWRSTDVGRALMLKGCAVACLFDAAVIGFWWPRYSGYAYINATIITGVVIGITYQLAVLWRRQRRREEAASRSA